MLRKNNEAWVINPDKYRPKEIESRNDLIIIILNHFGVDKIF